MSADDMIRRGDAEEAAHEADSLELAQHGARLIAQRIAALPAVTVGVKPLVWEHDGTCFRAVDPITGQTRLAVDAERAAASDADRATRILAALDMQPAPDAAAIREATARLHKLAYWLDTDAEVLADMDQRDLSDHQHIQAEVNAILALLPKGGA